MLFFDLIDLFLVLLDLHVKVGYLLLVILDLLKFLFLKDGVLLLEKLQLLFQVIVLAIREESFRYFW